MRILADENIPVVDAFFADQGSIRRLPGRAIDRAALAEVDVLLVRSVTEVSRAALAGSPVRFVGTCTIGTDHLDLDYFAEAGIAWSSAPGCNARGVVDYVLGCLLAMAEVRGADLAERTYGVVGAGQVGGRLVEVLRGLGWKVLVCDPPRQAREPDGEFVSLERLLAEADVISLHTPLNRDGEHPTRHLLDEPRLAALRPGTWLVNASRGAVVDNQALRRLLEGGADLEVALDVWEGEPQADPELAARCLIATPHIAGYSLEGKLHALPFLCVVAIAPGDESHEHDAKILALGRGHVLIAQRTLAVGLAFEQARLHQRVQAPGEHVRRDIQAAGKFVEAAQAL